MAYRDKRCRRCSTKYQNARRRDVIIQSNALRRIAKKDEVAAYQQERKDSGRQVEQAAAYYQAHREALKARALQYARDHPEQARASQLRHHRWGIEGMDALDMEYEVEYRKAIRNDPCFYCGGPGEHDDHYQALDGKPKGNNMWFNLVRACSSCNCSKRTMHGDDFLAKINPQKAARLAPLAYLWGYPGGWDQWLAGRKAHGTSRDRADPSQEKVRRILARTGARHLTRWSGKPVPNQVPTSPDFARPSATHRDASSALNCANAT
ncbi:hypothetical protein [Trebonia sp.]|uniref:hypothetical protein n=1 Tax=Trebonia sp. TaxID=2767075 RepID=UPI0026223950|nr:hypothetical protein [Trebonia sp.]